MTKTQEWWDQFFLGMAEYVSTASKDPSTKCGAVIVRPDNTVASVGYNGFARWMEDTPELYEDRDEKYSRIIHCEMNAILNARGPIEGCTLYVWPFLTCERCAVHVSQAGIDRVVCPQAPADKLVRWADSFKKARQYFDEAGIEVQEGNQ